MAQCCLSELPLRCHPIHNWVPNEPSSCCHREKQKLEWPRLLLQEMWLTANWKHVPRWHLQLKHVLGPTDQSVYAVLLGQNLYFLTIVRAWTVSCVIPFRFSEDLPNYVLPQWPVFCPQWPIMFCPSDWNLVHLCTLEVHLMLLWNLWTCASS